MYTTVLRYLWHQIYYKFCFEDQIVLCHFGSHFSKDYINKIDSGEKFIIMFILEKWCQLEIYFQTLKVTAESHFLLFP